MKKLIFLFAIAGFSSHTFAQDIITKKDATEMKVKVVKVGASEIEYKQWSNLDGPVYTVPTDDVFTIKYENGQRDVISQIIANSNNGSAKKNITLNTKPHYEGGFGFGYAINVNNWGDMAVFETVHGVRIMPYMFAGLGTGFYLSPNAPDVYVYPNGTVDISTYTDTFIPAFVELKGYYPFSDMCSIYASIDLGALISTGLNSDGAGFFGSFGPGVQVGKRRTKFDFSIRYQHYGKKNGAMLFRVGAKF